MCRFHLARSTCLRAFWRTRRNPAWLFPAADPGGAAAPTASGPIWNNATRDDGARYEPTGQLVSYVVN